MHRSGTSALTRALKALGVHLGDNLMSAQNENNEKGFWEDLDVYSLNEELLASLGSRWDDTVDITYKLGQGNLEFKNRAITLLRQKVDGRGCFSFKDPRVCRLLPFWQDVFDTLKACVQYVICLRNPLSVASSLYRRDEFPFEKSFILWLNHMLVVAEYTQKSPRIVIEYERFISDPMESFSRLAKFLCIDMNDLIHSEISAFNSQFLAPELQHSKFDVRDLENENRACQVVKKTYRLFRKLITEDSISVNENFNALIKEYKEWLPAIYFGSRIDGQLTIKIEEIKLLDKKIDKLKEETKEQEKHINILNNNIEELSNNYRKRGEYICFLENRVDEINSNYRKRGEYIEELESKIKNWEKKWFVRFFGKFKYSLKK